MGVTQGEGQGYGSRYEQYGVAAAGPLPRPHSGQQHALEVPVGAGGWGERECELIPMGTSKW